MERRSVFLMQADEEKEKAKADFFTAHVDPASKSERNGGAHFAYIVGLVKKYGSGFTVGSKPSIAGTTSFNDMNFFVTCRCRQSDLCLFGHRACFNHCGNIKECCWRSYVWYLDTVDRFCGQMLPCSCFWTT